MDEPVLPARLFNGSGDGHLASPWLTLFQMENSVAFASVALIVLVMGAVLALVGRGPTGRNVDEPTVLDHTSLGAIHDKVGPVFNITGDKVTTTYVGDHAEARKVLNGAEFAAGSAKWATAAASTVVEEPSCPVGGRKVLPVSNLLQPLVGSTFFHADGEDWRKRRRSVNALFASAASLDITALLVRQWIASLRDRTVAAAKDGLLIDVQHGLHSVTRASMLAVGFGFSADDLDCCFDPSRQALPPCASGAGTGTSGEYSTSLLVRRLCGAFEMVEAASTRARPNDVTDTLASAADGPEAATPQALDACRAAVDLVASTLARGDPPASVSGCMAARLLAAGVTPGETTASVFNLVIAGAESTAAMLGKTAWCVARDPSLQGLLQEEVEAQGLAAELAGRSDTAAASDHHHHAQVAVALQQVRRLVLMEAVVREGLRLFAPATAVTRGAIAATSVAGCPVAAGQRLSVTIPSIHRAPNTFPRPLTFEPARFLRPVDRARLRAARAEAGVDAECLVPAAQLDAAANPTATRAKALRMCIPFSAGPRRCPGEAVAVMQSCLLLAGLLAAFRLEATQARGAALDHASGLFTEWNSNGVWLRLHPRE